MVYFIDSCMHDLIVSDGARFERTFPLNADKILYLDIGY